VALGEESRRRMLSLGRGCGSGVVFGWEWRLVVNGRGLGR